MLSDERKNARGDQDAAGATTRLTDHEPAHLESEKQADGLRLVLSGDWRHSGVASVQEEMARLASSETASSITVDIGGASHFDTAGAWLVRRLQIGTEARGGSFIVEGPEPSVRLIGALPDVTESAHNSGEARKPLFNVIFEPVGRSMYDLWEDLIASAYILGSAVRGAQMKLDRRSGVSPASVVAQLDHMGVRAVPIIVLMSFLIGAIIAQQGAFQLRYFGAEVFVVDLVGILQLREIGVLLTAIMIAGRSGSAITAEIGSMKMREEVDALKVMGLNPIGVLVFPRLLALVVALPLLTVIANFSALFGAAVVALAYSGITFDVFLGRLREAIDISTIASGMIKAPFMALIIGIVAAVEGLKVGGSAESLGRRVTSSVVKSIFVVILVDGLFAMFYAAIDF
jgi:phospholipid/cholesterol/gamma-HCH transport system permease protein